MISISTEKESPIEKLISTFIHSFIQNYQNSDNNHIKFNYITKSHRKLDLKAGSQFTRAEAKSENIL